MPIEIKFTGLSTRLTPQNHEQRTGHESHDEKHQQEPLRFVLRQVVGCVELTWQPERTAEQLDEQHLQAKQVEPDGW